MMTGQIKASLKRHITIQTKEKVLGLAKHKISIIKMAPPSPHAHLQMQQKTEMQ